MLYVSFPYLLTENINIYVILHALSANSPSLFCGTNQHGARLASVRHVKSAQHGCAVDRKLTTPSDTIVASRLTHAIFQTHSTFSCIIPHLSLIFHRSAEKFHTNLECRAVIHSRHCNVNFMRLIFVLRFECYKF